MYGEYKSKKEAQLGNSAAAMANTGGLVTKSMAKNDDKVRLEIDWEAIGLVPENVELFAPEISKFQPEKTWNLNEPILIPKGKGFLIIIRNIKD